MSLTATFSLSPRESWYYVGDTQRASLWILGVDIIPEYREGLAMSFNGQYADDRLFFNAYTAADPMLDYTIWGNRRCAHYIQLSYNLSSLGTNKELALIFGFQAINPARVLIYTDAGLLGDQALDLGDNQFLIEVESLNSLSLYFIHACLDGINNGGGWFFEGINGYVV